LYRNSENILNLHEEYFAETFILSLVQNSFLEEVIAHNEQLKYHKMYLVEETSNESAKVKKRLNGYEESGELFIGISHEAQEIKNTFLRELWNLVDDDVKKKVQDAYLPRPIVQNEIYTRAEKAIDRFKDDYAKSLKM